MADPGEATIPREPLRITVTKSNMTPGPPSGQADAPAFDPNQPFDPVAHNTDEAPPFDPSKAFETGPAPAPPDAAGSLFGTGEGGLTPADVQVIRPLVDPVMRAFGQGFGEAWDSKNLDIPPEDVSKLAKLGIFAPEGTKSYRDEGPVGVFHAFNELLLGTVWKAGQAAYMGTMGTYAGLQAAAVQMGVPVDVAHLPDAFAGSPHPMGIPRVEGVRGGAPPSDVAGLKYHGSPEAFDHFDPAKAPFFFSSDAAQASNYAVSTFGRRGGAPKEMQPHVVPAYLKMEKPFEVSLANLDDAAHARDAEWLRQNGYDSAILRDPNDPSATEFAVLDPSQVIPHFSLAHARELGVIGPLEKPLPVNAKPAEVAQRAIPADQARPDTVTREVGGDNPWRDRFEQFVGKLEAPGDVKQLIRDAADQNGEFQAARQGDIPLRQVGYLEEAAGVEPGSTDIKGLGRLLQNDNQVRIAMRMMVEATDAVKRAAADVKSDGSPANLQKFQEAMMRRDMAVEQVVGHRAEWGRTGNVFQEFMRTVKDEESFSQYLKDKGRSPDDLKDIANAVDSLDRPTAARVLNGARAQPGPIYWTWINGLISGIITHTKYIAANGLYAGVERGVTTPMASVIGKAKQIIGADAERVFFGEGAASVYGMIAATPTSLMAAARAIKTGMRVPMESEVALRDAAVARGDKVPASLERAVNPVSGQVRPIPGVWGRIIGAPGDVASGIHTVFKIMGERAGLEAEAYRKAAEEGLSPANPQFWQRRTFWAANPTEAMRQTAVDGAYKGTFMQELGPRGKAWQKVTKDIPGIKWLFPFSHIPINLMKATYEYTPFSVLDGDMRANIKGEHGGRAQDMAIARMVVGSSVMGYFVNQYMAGRATGDYPLDPKERDAWKLTGKQPNSILIGNYWYSFERFGPAGDLASLGANIGSVIEHLQADDDDHIAKATVYAANAAARIVADEVGFQSLRNIFDASHDENKLQSWLANQVGTAVPFSSLLAQTASVMDPDMREAKTLIDGLKYRIPVVREGLLPKRDWTGLPLANPGYHAIIRNRVANVDPVDLEMHTLGIHPGAPQDRLGGVKLPPKLYDLYQTTAGALTRTTLESIVSKPGWSDLPAFLREKVIKDTIRATRESAGAIIQAGHPQIIQQGIDDAMAHIEGRKPGKLRE